MSITYTDGGIDKFGKCSLFPKEGDNNNYHLVTGDDRNTKHMYCSATRDNEMLCGKEGKMYKKKYIKRGILKENAKDNETHYIV